MHRCLPTVIYALLSTAAVLACAENAGALDTRAAREQLSRRGRIRFNRVEGLYLGYRMGIHPRRVKGVVFNVETGYGFDSQKMRWEAGVSYETHKASATVSVFDRTDTNDRGNIGTGENTLLTILFKWDYMDYFRARNGFELKGRRRIKRHLNAVSSVSAFSYERMPVVTDWSLFYGDRAHRINPAVKQGKVGLFKIGLVYDNRRRSPLFRNAWLASGVYRRAFREFDHNALILSATRYQKTIFGRQAAIASLTLGTVQSTAEQFLFDLGGVGTLRGYEIKEYTGNRLIRFSVDYLFRGDIMHRIPLRGFDLLNLILFADAGWLNARPKSRGLLEGFGDLALGDIKTDVGVSLALPRQVFRFDVARRLDRSRDPWVISLRIKYRM